MTRKVLNEILCKHKLWLDDADGGELADLRCANMQDADMRHADMRHANMRYADMQRAYMLHANMRYANLQEANLRYADMRYADLREADMRGADMRYANMRYANIRGANMRGADMRGADIDYSAWPMWCGSLKAHVDDRIAIQLLYHTLSVVQHSPYVSEEIKRTLLTPDVVKVANRFHRVDECGELKAHDNVEVSE